MFNFLFSAISGDSFSGLAKEDNFLGLLLWNHSMTGFYLVILGAIVAAYFIGNISPATLIGRAMGVIEDRKSVV